MDKLDVIFDMQSKLNGYITKSRGLAHAQDDPAYRSEWIQRQLLALMSEMTEVLDEVNYKWWKNEREINERALKEEVVDMLHFMVSIALTAGLDARELFDIYLEKNEENFKRQFGTSAKQGYALDEETESR